MFEPRPEISTATRLRSGIVGGAPAAVRSGHGAAAPPSLDPADLEHRLAGAFERCADRSGVRPGDDGGHPDPAIEGPRHFLRGDRPARLEHREAVSYTHLT